MKNDGNRLKRFLAFILIFAMLASGELQTVVYAGTRSLQEDSHGSGLNIDDELTVEGSGSFGNLLAADFKKEAKTQQENNGCNIFSVDMEGTTAKVSLETVKDATLVVGFFDEDGIKLLASASAPVKAGQKEAAVSVTEKLPQYFYLRAFLADSNQRPLCTSYGSSLYTKEMQELLKKKTTDFDKDKVLNLDNDTANNFAVYSDNTKIISQENGKNTVTKADDNTNTYVITDADQQVMSLKAGDVFAYQYKGSENQDGPLIVKVGKIEISGATVTITGADTSTDEVFDYVKIDEENDLGDAKIDTSLLDDGITYDGLTGNAAGKKKLYGKGISGKVDKEMKFTLDKKVESNKKPFSGQAEIKGTLKFAMSASCTLYLTPKRQYIEMELGYSQEVGINVNASVSCEVELGRLEYRICLGTYIRLTPALLAEVSGKAEIKGTHTGSLGFRASTEEGLKNISSPPDFKADMKAEITAFIGISLKPEIKVISDKVSASMKGTLGAEIKGTLVHGGKSGNAIHDCKNCIDGTVTGKSKVEFNATVIKWNWSLSFEGSIKICDFYFSLDKKTGGLTKCPYCSYRVDIVVAGDKKAVRNAKIEDLFSDGKDHVTGADGKVSGYLKPGLYTMMVTAAGYEPEAQVLIVENKAVQARVTMKKKKNSPQTPSQDSPKDPSQDVPLQPGSSQKVSKIAVGHRNAAAITEDGSLYMWGDNSCGQIGDGTTEDRLTPVKVMDNVESVYLQDQGDSKAWSGAITKDGSLYMWGYNGTGQLGDGTTIDRTSPVRILSNVTAVSLEAFGSSGAVQRDGSLYVWGENYDSHLKTVLHTVEDPITSPFKVLTNVKSVSLGGYNSSAVKEDGSLYMWGRNSYGTLGNGTENTRRDPFRVLSNVNFSCLVENNSLAVKKDGSLYMWGKNWWKQVAGGKKNDVWTPAELLTDVVSAECNSCFDGTSAWAIAKDGSLYTWGRNGSYQLGDGTQKDRETPQKVLFDVKICSMDEGTGGAVTQDGTLYLWGKGFDTGEHRPVEKMKNVKMVSVNAGAVGVVKEDGSLYMGGVNYDVKLGNGTKENSETLVKVTFPASTLKSTPALKKVTVKTSSAAPTLKSSAESKVNTESKNQTAEFIGLQPDTDYTFYVLKEKKEAGLLDADNLLYINQYKADSAGKLTVNYQAKEPCTDAVQLLVGAAGIVLKGTDVVVSDLNYTGEEQMVFPTVTCKGRTLEEGTDYEVSGDIIAKDKGTYSIIVTGTGDYSGTVTKTYQIKDYSSDDTQGTGIVLKGTDVTVSDLVYTGKEQRVSPVVICKGKRLKEGTDYEVYGDITVKNKGTYSLTVMGIGNYTGVVTKTYQVKERPSDDIKKPEDVSKPDTGIKTETFVNAAGKTVSLTTETTVDASGKITSVAETYRIAGAAKNTDVTVKVKKNGKNKVLSARATVMRSGKETESGSVKSTVSLSVVEQIVEAAGIYNVAVTQKVVDEDNNTLYTLLYNAEDVENGELFTLVRVNKKTGEKTLVNQKTYQVSDAGNISVTINGSGTYRLLNEDDAYALGKKILKTIKMKVSSKTLKPGKTYTAAVSAKLNRKNVKSITFSSTKKSVATVNKKTGKVKAKKPGTAIIKAKVTLKNGEVKIVKMKIKVKK